MAKSLLKNLVYYFTGICKPPYMGNIEGYYREFLDGDLQKMSLEKVRFYRGFDIVTRTLSTTLDIASLAIAGYTRDQLYLAIAGLSELWRNQVSTHIKNSFEDDFKLRRQSLEELSSEQSDTI